MPPSLTYLRSYRSVFHKIQALSSVCQSVYYVWRVEESVLLQQKLCNVWPLGYTVRQHESTRWRRAREGHHRVTLLYRRTFFKVNLPWKINTHRSDLSEGLSSILGGETGFFPSLEIILFGYSCFSRKTCLAAIPVHVRDKNNYKTNQVWYMGKLSKNKYLTWYDVLCISYQTSCS